MGMSVWVKEPGRKTAQDHLTDPGHYFRDCYNPCSLANWLTRNVDPEARGEWGLAIFTEPALPLNSPAWRAQLLRLVTRWSRKAHRLRGKASVAGYPGDEPIPVSEDDVAHYIHLLEDLLILANEVKRRKLRVKVCW